MLKPSDFIITNFSELAQGQTALCVGVRPYKDYNRQACYNFVYVVSNWKLEDQYHNIRLEQTETWNALMRRIHKVRIYTAPGEWQEYDTTDYLHGFQPVDRADTPFNN